MILQALKEYYDRKPDLPRYGFENKEIGYVITLQPDGTPVSLEPTYEGEGKKRRARSFLVPHSVKKSVNIKANLFWDNPEYALGIVLKDKKRSVKKTEEKVKQRVAEQHADFKKRIDDLGNIDDEGLQAIKCFLQKENKEAFLRAISNNFDEFLQEGASLSFKLIGDNCLVLERPAVKSAIQQAVSISKETKNICLVTGEKDELELTHTAIKGVWGAQSSGANIVSFNLEVFRSFGKDQGANAPVGKVTAFAYTTALNHLLGKDSRQRMQVGDASTVFWAEKETSFEQQIIDFFGEPSKDDPDRNVRAVESLFKSIQTGAFLTEDEKNKFYVLGLAPNASRISVRFWIVNTVKGMSGKIQQHFDDTKIVPPKNQKDTWPKWQSLNALLATTANEVKYDKAKTNLVYFRGRYYDVKPNLAGDTIRTILEGLPYPQTLLQAAIRRIRAEHDITYPRAALIKAYLNRSMRYQNPNIKEELKVSLDGNNMNIGYRLGRLFAVLEKIQQEANPGINATIRDKFYGAASSTPVTVFGNLMRLKNHHLAKLKHQGRKVSFEKLLGEIIDGVDAKISFPPHLPLEDQGRFAIGYYHQMQNFFTKKSE